MDLPEFLLRLQDMILRPPTARDWPDRPESPSDQEDEVDISSSDEDAVPSVSPASEEDEMARAIRESLADQQRMVDEEQAMLRLIEQTKREEDETRRIREFVSNRECLQELLATLKGVDPFDPIFEQFYE